MITVSIKKIKNFSSDDYNQIIDDLPFNRLTCTCGHSGCFTKHAYYFRSIKTPEGIEKLRILRVKCNCCNKTHAILPEWVVPYSAILIDDHIEIIRTHFNGKSYNPIMKINPEIDESDIKYVIRQFKNNWNERLTAFRIPIDNYITKICFRIFSRQFMQIKCTPNILFS